MSYTIQGGTVPPLHPLALAFEQSLSYHTVSVAVCLPMVCKASDLSIPQQLCVM
jgi:hypothetical protein